ncbi:MAG: preprotein translocase subunit YajC [Christensenellaceae bacterium]|jgi:preprotein translocase YajC subunit|nr:preprotein translocase subunit YajC [Christensenellaceae bacterium]
MIQLNLPIFSMLGASADAGTGSNIGMYILLGGLFLFMIGFSIFSQRKQRKRRSELLESITTGDSILTIGGFVGTIVEFNPDNKRYTVNIAPAGSEPVVVVILREAIREKIA